MESNYLGFPMLYEKKKRGNAEYFYCEFLNKKQKSLNDWTQICGISCFKTEKCHANNEDNLTPQEKLNFSVALVYAEALIT